MDVRSTEESNQVRVTHGGSDGTESLARDYPEQSRILTSSRSLGSEQDARVSRWMVSGLMLTARSNNQGHSDDTAEGSGESVHVVLAA